LVFFGLGLGGFYGFPLVSFDFLRFPLIFFGLGLGGFYGFPLVSFGFVWFPREKERKIKSKEKTNQSRKV